MSATVKNLFISNKLIEGDKVKAFSLPKKEVTAEAEVAPEPAEVTPTADEPAAETEAAA